ncbi:MAG: tetratricopeptide repeat protein [Chlorobi bacterium]|nr:tetratricopeptide repeat protein [Chlorobiota bacterium]
MKQILLILAITIASLSSFSQKYKNLLEQAENAFNNYEFAKAVDIGEKALEKVQKSKGVNSVEYATLKSDVAIYYYYNYNDEECQKYLDEAIEIVRNIKGEENDDFIKVYANKGYIASLNQKYKTAEVISAKLLRLTEKLHGKNNEDYTILLSNYALIINNLGQYNKALQLFFNAKELFKVTGLDKKVEYADLLNNIASTYQDLGKFLDAENYYQKAAKLYKKFVGANDYSYATVKRNLGDLYLSMNRNDDAIKALYEAQDIYINVVGEQSAENAHVLSFIAVAAKNRGDYTSSEDYYLKAKEIFKKTVGEKSATYLQCLSNLANLYSTTGRFNEAEILYNEAINNNWLVDENPIKYLTFLQNLGLLYINMQEYDKAKSILESSYRQYKLLIGKDDYNTVFIINNLAGVYAWLGETEKSIETYNKSIQLLKDANLTNIDDYYTAVFNLAITYIDKNDYKNAQLYLIEALKIAKKIKGNKNPEYSINLGILAWTYEMLGNYNEAEKYYLQAMKNLAYILQKNFMFMSALEKEKLWAQFKLQFAEFNYFALKRYEQNPEILNFLYRYNILSKSVILNSARKLIKKIFAKNDAGLIAKFNKYRASKEYLNKLYSIPEKNIVSNTEIDSLEKQINIIEKQLINETQAFANDEPIENFSWEDVKNVLNKNEAAIEIIRVPNYGSENEPYELYYAALIIKSETTNYPELVIFKNGRDMDGKLSDEYYYKIFNKTEDTQSYNYFWGPINEKLNGINKIYLGIDGIYEVLNVNTLKNPETNRFLIEDYDIRLVSNTKQIIDIKKREQYNFATHNNSIALFGYPNYYLDVTKGLTSDKDKILALGQKNQTRKFERQFQYINDLPGTKKEVNLINGILKENNWQTAIYEGNNALENKVKKLNNPTILHLATHGFFDFDITDENEYTNARVIGKIAKRNPLFRSGILLAGSGFVLKMVEGDIQQLHNLEDGVLSAYEASVLNLDKTEIVILSACLTRVGNIKLNDSEGYYGMLSAFLMAGAKSVIASCWPVDDFATQELMTIFYSNLVHSNDKYKTFREAQIELIKKYPEPYYWGAFIMVGD